MNRRSFLASLGFGTVAAAAAANSLLDVERLLWVPGEKTIFLPPPIAPLGFGLMRGDVFTIEGVYAVSPTTYHTLPFLQQFVVTADVLSGATLGMEQLHPRIIPDGAYMNVSASPARSGRIDGTLVQRRYSF